MRFDSLRHDVVRSIKQRWLLKYWNEIRNGRAVPRWGDLESSEIQSVSDAVNFLQVVRAGDRMRFRIEWHGKSIGLAHGGVDCRGKFLDEVVPPAFQEPTFTTYRHAVASGLPVYTISDMIDRDGRLVHYERLLLPFVSTGTHVDRVLGSLETISPAGAYAQRDLMSSADAAPTYHVCGTIDLVTAQTTPAQ
jgi:hypothetical protein